MPAPSTPKWLFAKLYGTDLKSETGEDSYLSQLTKKKKKKLLLILAYPETAFVEREPE